MPQILVLGAKGQVGRELLKAPLPPAIEVQGLARSDLDIGDQNAVYEMIDAIKPALVINAAAYTAVDKAETERASANMVNCEAPGYLAAACARREIALLHISTDYVFDGTKLSAYHEEDSVCPLGVYGASKEAGERAIRAEQPRHVILRTAWVFGAEGHNFVKTMLRLAETRDELAVVADQMGGPTAAADIAAALLEIARQILSEGRADAWGTYHFAGQPSTAWYDFALEIFAQREVLTGVSGPSVKAITTKDFPTPAKRPANSVLDCAKISAAFGLAQPDWRLGLNQMLREILL